jgi:3-hydroxyisobutyrate dehydrogenase-like beta-hydroxyacid dehydrogenase
VRGGRLGCQGESGRDGDRRAQRRLGGTNASRDNFPRSILPRAFDYGFATGLIVKDVRLHLDEAKTPGVSTEVADAVARLWEVVIDELGPESDFTAAIKPIERAAGVVVGGKQQN